MSFWHVFFLLLLPQIALPGQNKTGHSAFQHCKPWISFPCGYHTRFGLCVFLTVSCICFTYEYGKCVIHMYICIWVYVLHRGRIKKKCQLFEHQTIYRLSIKCCYTSKILLLPMTWMHLPRKYFAGQSITASITTVHLN